MMVFAITMPTIHAQAEARDMAVMGDATDTDVNRNGA